MEKNTQYTVVEKIRPGRPTLTKVYAYSEDGQVKVTDWIEMSIALMSFDRPCETSSSSVTVISESTSPKYVTRRNATKPNDEKRRNLENILKRKLPSNKTLNNKQFNHRMLLSALNKVNENNAAMKRAIDSKSLDLVHTRFGFTCIAAERMYDMFLRGEYVPPFERNDLTFVMQCDNCHAECDSLENLIAHMTSHYSSGEVKRCFLCRDVSLDRADCADHWEVCEWTSVIREFVRKFTFCYYCQKNYVNTKVTMKLHSEWIMNKDSYVYKAIQSERCVFSKDEIEKKLRELYPSAFLEEENV